MGLAEFNEFLSEKQKIEDFLNRLEIELDNCLNDFEKVSLEKLHECDDAIKDNEGFATAIGGSFYKDYISFKNKFDHLVLVFENLQRFKIEVILEDFLNDIQMLKKDLF